jgi:hypothetical protein
MTGKITIGDRSYYKHLGEWRLKAHNGGAYDTYTNECCSPLLDEIERLRKERDNWQTASERIAGDLEKSDDEIQRLQAELDLIAKGIAKAHQLQAGETYTLTWFETGWTVKP